MNERRFGKRRMLAAGLAIVFGALTTVVLLRSDGVEPTNVSATSATRWLVHQPSGRVVLADGLAGRVTARIDPDTSASTDTTVQGPSGAYLLIPEGGAVRPLDTASLQLGAQQTVAVLSSTRAVVGSGPQGLVAADPLLDEVSFLTATETRPLQVPAFDEAKVGIGGDLWLIAGNTLYHFATDGRRSTNKLTIRPQSLITIGDTAVAVDIAAGSVQWAGRSVQAIPFDNANDSIVQEPGPDSDCLWFARGDQMACIGPRGVDRELTIAGLAAAPGDRLAIAGSIAFLLRANNAGLERINLNDQSLIDGAGPTFRDQADLVISVTDDLIWLDDQQGDTAWAFSRYGFTAIEKNDDSAPLLDEQGEPAIKGEGSNGGDTNIGTDDNVVVDDRPLEDNNGVDDPPVAVDDSVSARQDTVITIPATGNDYDPDGEGIVILAVTNPGHGTIDIVDAGSVTYSPDRDYKGKDTFTYSIVDRAGNKATATVSVELFDNNSPNRAPLSTPDSGSTASNTPVVIEVLLNDVDPERDPLDIASSQAGKGGSITRSVGPSGLPALRYTPMPGFQGTDTFSYVATDPAGGLGVPVDVVVEVRRPNATNEAPIVRPDAVRVRGGASTTVAVLLNDTDSDNDSLTFSLQGQTARGVQAGIDGSSIRVSALAGAPALSELLYLVDDGQGHRVRGRVLVAVVGDSTGNLPPIANSDVGSVVVGSSTAIAVVNNDTDPDGDPVVLVGVQQPSNGEATVTIEGGSVRFVPSISGIDQPVRVSFGYTVSDGRGGSADGLVVVTVLSEALPDPPYAQDDAAATLQDTPVSIDVLRNDGDPSGERPSLVGAPSCPVGGTATISSDQRVTFRPSPNSVGVFRCRYEVTNTSGKSASASIVITVTAPPLGNRDPEAIDRTINVKAGESVQIDLSQGVTDPDGDPLQFGAPTLPSIGTVSVVGTIATYTAPAATEGPTLFTYAVSDGNGGQTTARVLIRITAPGNLAPVAATVSRVTERGVPISVDVLGLASDDGPLDQLIITGVSQTSGGGTVSRAGGVITFTPSDTFVGTMEAAYTIADRDGLTSTGRITVEVLQPKNRAPVAANDSLSVVSGGSGSVNVLANDSDLDNDPISIVSIGSVDPSKGSLSFSGGTLTFTASPSVDGFTVIVPYTITDGALTASSSVSITVQTCSQGRPTAQNKTVEIGYQEPYFIDLTLLATNGTIRNVSGAGLTGPTGTYTPSAGENGFVTVTFTVSNSCQLTANGTLTIDVNQNPVPATITRSVRRGRSIDIPVSALATDKEPLTIVDLVGNPGWISRTASSIRVNAPSSGGPASITFTAVVRDPGGLQASATVTVTLDDNLPPIVTNDSVNVSDGTFSFNPVSNDGDPEAGPLTLQSASFIDGDGSVSVSGNNLIIDAPHGDSVIGYTIVDDAGLTASGTVSIRFNRPPEADDIGPIDASQTIDLSNYAFDPDDDALSATLPQGAPPGVVWDLNGLDLTLDLTEFVGQASFQYAVTDSFGAQRLARIYLDVPPPDGG